MKHVKCARCATEHPMNEMFTVLGETLCEPCGDRKLAERGGAKLPDGAVLRMVDPTVCFHCSTDYGSQQLRTVAELPACEACMDKFMHYPFPGWIKASAAVLGLLLVAVMMVNARYFTGYREANGAFAAFEAGDFPAAARLIAAARDHVPECKPYGSIASLYRGVQLMNEDKFKEALPLLKSARSELQDKQLDLTVFAAEAAIAFDEKDYDGFLEANEKMAALQPNEPMALGAVASAHACRYAVSGAEESRQKAMEWLGKAEAILKGANPEFLEYKNRVLHRLATREIISPKEFKKKYPNGWKEGSGQ